MIHPNLAAIAATLPQVKSGTVRAFLDYMQRIHPADRLPGRRDIDPLHIPGLLPHVVLVEVHRQPPPEPARFFVRLAGEAILSAAPMPMMNRFLTFPPQPDTPAADVRNDVRQQVLANGQIYYWNGPPRLKFRLDFAHVEYVHCPLAEDGVTIDRIFSILHYQGSAAR
jgi:hypothetical protein